MKTFIKTFLLSIVVFSTFSQSNSSVLQSDGVLVPRVSSGTMTGISSPETGQLVFNTNTNTFWYHNGSVWTEIAQNTDSQTIDVLSLNSSTLHLSLSNDGEPNKTLDLSAINSDNQNLDVLSLIGNTLNISLSGDGQSTRTLDLSSLSGGGGSSPVYIDARGFISGAGDNRYGIFGSGFGGSITGSEYPVMKNGTINNLFGMISRQLNSGSKLKLTLVKNGVDTNLSIEFDSGDAAYATLEDTSHPISVSKGDRITFKTSETGSTAPGGNTYVTGFAELN